VIDDILIIAALLFSAAFFAGSETAFVSCNRFRLYNLKRKGNASARSAYFLLEKSERLLATSLVGTNISLVLSANLVARLMAQLSGRPRPFLSVAMVTVATLLLCEVLPKNIALRRSDTWTLITGIPMRLLHYLFYPVGILFTVLTRVVLRMAGISQHRPGEGLFQKKEDVKFFLTTHVEARLTKNESRYFLESLEVSDKTLNDVMTPLVDLHALPRASRVRDCRKLIEEHKVSYIPVFDERIFNICGVLTVHELFGADAGESIQPIMTDPVFMPETKNIIQLYREMYLRNYSVVFAVDEFGGITGLATMYDIGEEILGKFTGLDRTTLFTRISEHDYLSDGDVEIDEINLYLGTHIPDDDFTTVNGLIVHTLGKIPDMGDAITVEGYRFSVEKSNRRKAEVVRIRRVR
jgi:putative hemolysin